MRYIRITLAAVAIVISIAAVFTSSASSHDHPPSGDSGTHHSSGGSALPTSNGSRSSSSSEPPCAIKNPPFSPRRAGDIVIAQISNRCTTPVYKLGAWGCLQVAPYLTGGVTGRWSNIACEANEVRAKALLILQVDARCKAGKMLWPYVYRVQGYVWVDYDPVPGKGEYRSYTVTSAYVPIYLQPPCTQY